MVFIDKLDADACTRAYTTCLVEVQIRSDVTSHTMLFFVMHTKLDQTGLNWFALVTANYTSKWNVDVKHWMLHWKFLLLLVMVFIDKLDADACTRAC